MNQARPRVSGGGVRMAGRRLVIVAASAALACTARKEAPKVPLGQTLLPDSVRAEQAAHALLGPAAKAALDSGNILFRQGAYAAALERYRSAAALAPQQAAPQFGIYMVGRATNNTTLVDSALAGIRARSGSLPASPHAMSDSALERLHDTLRTRAPAS